MINNNSQFTDLSKYLVSIKGEDITESVSQIAIFQDVFSPVWSCQIDVMDTINMLTNYGIKANDEVTIKLKTEQKHDTDGELTLRFYIHDIGNKQFQNHKVMSYTILCAQKSFIKNQLERVCEIFDNKKAEDIVRDVIQKHLTGSLGDHPPQPEQLKSSVPYVITDGTRSPSKSDNNMTYIATNISPFTVIANMLRTALCNEKADFVFYTKYENKFSFESLSNLYKRKPCVKFIQVPNHVKKHGNYLNNKNLEFSTFLTDHFSTLSNIAAGYDANTVVQFDFIKKKWDSKDTKRKGSDIIGTPESNIHFLPVHKQMFDEGDNIYDFGKEWYGSRRTTLFTLEQNLTRIQLPGHVKAFGWLSETCEIDLPANNSMTEDNLDSRFAGKYLIVAIGHIITKAAYYINVELANGWDK